MLKRHALRFLFIAAALVGRGALYAQSGLLVGTTDFQTGSTTFVSADLQRTELDLLLIHSDAVVRYHEGRVYIINRLGQDNILVLDPADLRTPLVQFSTGNGTNPQDIEFAAPTRAYVSRLASATLLVVDPTDGTELGQIDLSAFADDDGLPEAAQMARVGSRLYVACQRLDRNKGFSPAGQSVLAVVDMESDTLIDMDPEAAGIQGIVLSAANPNSLIAVGRRLFIGAVAGFGDMEGGIEVIDLDAGRSRGVVLSEATLGGDILSLALLDSERGFAVVSDANFANSVRPVNLSSGAVEAPLSGLSGGFIPDLAVDGARLIVADRGTFEAPDAAGLVVFDAFSAARLAGPISTGLPPSSIAVLGPVEIPTAVEEEKSAGPRRAALGAAYPNPFNGATLIPFEVSAARARVSLDIYDTLGRRIRSLVEGVLPAGAHLVSWDGRDEGGRTVGSGAYFAELRAGSRRAVAKLMLLK